MNSICLLGRLTADPELRTTQTGIGVTGFKVAVDRSYTDRDGNKRTAYEVVADNVFFAESKNGGTAPVAPTVDYSDRVPQSAPPADDFEVIQDNDDDLPF